MYMLGRLRTASSPSRTVMALASYAGLSGLGALASAAISGSGRFSGLTSDTVLLWLHTVVTRSVRDPGTCIAVHRPGSGTGSGHTRRRTVPGASAACDAEHPGHLVRQAAESFFSLPVGTDKTSLRRPANASFRQK